MTQWPTERRINKLLQALREGKEVAGLDGLLKDSNGGVGWKLAVSTGRLAGLEIQSGAAPVDGAPEEQSSTRCELQGILGWMATIEKLLGRQATGTIEAGCDSDAALKGIQKWLYKKHTTRAIQGGANIDLLREIRAVMRQLPEMTVKWVKVKVHRKREAETYHEVINDEMETLANTLHDNIVWQSKETAHHFTSALTELNIWDTHHGYT